MQSQANAALKKHGKSFNFARFFLDEKTGSAATRLYYFCRQIDDIADDPQPSIDPSITLNNAIEAIHNKQYTDPLVGDFLLLCDDYQILPEWGIQLIRGVLSDLSDVALTTQDALITYAFQVAGVVGLMMTPILGGPIHSYKYAVDLGIAMQLTNIARDVLEDATINRRYIPGEWLDDLTAKQIVAPNKEQKSAVQLAIKRLLVLADEYYESGFSGIMMLPKNHQLGILVAGKVYRQIGIKITKQNYAYWQGRTVVSSSAKLLLASRCLWEHHLIRIKDHHIEHAEQLHLPIKHLINLP